MIKVLEAIVKFAGIIIKVVQWVLVNGIPFIRGIIEEIKALRQKQAEKKAAKIR